MAIVRPAAPSDFELLLPLRQSLWPDSTAAELRAMLRGPHTLGGLPAAILVALAGAEGIAGFVEVSLRSYADGCDPAQPAGYLEGWFVHPAHRRQRIAAALLHAAENWARAHGCREMASDTWLDNAVSHRAHLALGFEEVDRCIHYRKSLTPEP
ncbi:MAG: GNAT family N-acetyltransferase [Bryobacteraceae bacterium]